MIRTDLKTTVRGASHWLAKRAIGPFRRRRRELARTEWLDADALAAYQLTRLRKLLQRCATSVPYYQRLFAETGFDPAGVESLADLQRLAILSKQTVAHDGRALRSTRVPRWLASVGYTGGTTGTPSAIWRDWTSLGNEHAFVRRQWDWAGIGLGDRCAYLTGRIIAPPDQTRGPLWRYDPFMRELILSTYHLGDAVVPDYAEAIRAAGAVALVAYPSAALTLARGCLARDLRLPLRAVLTTSETLLPEARELIARAFECPVFDFYGSAERVCYIFTCPQGTYHIIPEYGITELHPVDDPPGAARVVATGLWNLAMPLLRFDMQDLVVPGEKPCPCGRAFPTVQRIVGRPGDQLVTPSGRRLGAALLTHVLYGARNIVESQLVQDAVDHVVLRYVPRPEFTDEDRAALTTLIAMHLPSELTVELQAVEQIPRGPSGKLRPVVGLPNGVAP